MAPNFLACDRDQELLLPPSLADWLPEEHLAWFVLDAVEQIDLNDFYASYRDDGWGRAAFDPKMMLALLLYAYAAGERSSRAIERRCHEDVAFRVIAANATPDHATIARFRARHERALGELFTEILRLCAQAGLAAVGTIAVDGTKIAADASARANRTYAAISAEVEAILAEAEASDEREDALHGDRRGDELPAELAAPASRRARLAEAKRRLDAEHEAQHAAHAEHLRRRAAAEAERGKPLRGRKPKPPPRGGRSRREGEHHRPRLAAGALPEGLRAGLQRAGCRQRAPGDPRSRALGRLSRLAAARADRRGRPGGAREPHRALHARRRTRRRRLLERPADRAARRLRERGARQSRLKRASTPRRGAETAA